jgi:hypothetical protein
MIKYLIYWPIMFLHLSLFVEYKRFIQYLTHYDEVHVDDYH